MIGLKADGTPYKVLVVDDSLFVQNQIKKLLEAEGFEVIGVASHGKEAVEKYEAFFPDIDLVTMDITMPGMHGVEALKEIRKIDPEACVVIVSALGKSDLMKEAFLNGAVHYIVKPLKREEMIKTLTYALGTMVS